MAAITLLAFVYLVLTFGSRGVAQGHRAGYVQFLLLLLNCVTPSLPRFRLKCHLGEVAMKEDKKTKILIKHPGTNNFAGVEYFRVLDRHETNVSIRSCRQVNPGLLALTSKHLHFSLPSLGCTAASPSPALSRSSPVPPLLCAVGHVRRRPALGVAGLDSCVIPFLFLQRPLILWEVFTTQDSHDTCSLSTSSDCSSRDWDKTPSTRTHRGKLFLNY